MPAPALQSEPAIVNATGTVAALCLPRRRVVEAGGRRLRWVAIGFGGTDRRQEISTVSRVADCLDGTAFHRFLAETFFLRGFRLLVHVGVAPIIIPFEIRGSGLAAQIAVDALIIDIEFARYVLGVFVRCVGHVSLKVNWNV